MDGGSLKNLWDTVEEEIAIANVFGAHLNPNKMTLYLMAGDYFNSDHAEGDAKTHRKPRDAGQFQETGGETGFQPKHDLHEGPRSWIPGVCTAVH